MGEEREECQHFVQTSWRGKHKQTASELGAREGKEERGEVEKQSTVQEQHWESEGEEADNRATDIFIKTDYPNLNENKHLAALLGLQTKERSMYSGKP